MINKALSLSSNFLPAILALIIIHHLINSNSMANKLNVKVFKQDFIYKRFNTKSKFFGYDLVIIKNFRSIASIFVRKGEGQFF